MPSPRSLATLIMPLAVGVCVGATVWGCSGEHGRTKGQPASPPPYPPVAAGSAGTGAPSMQWDSAAGPAIVLALDSTTDSVSVVRPEFVARQGAAPGATPGAAGATGAASAAPGASRPLSRARFDLFGRSGEFGTAMLTTSPSSTPNRSEDGCTAWPVAAISSARKGWSVALGSGHARVIPLDSIQGMAPADSALFAAQVIRLVSSVLRPHDPVFDNIPFVVRSAYRFQTSVIDGIVASTQRTIPSEATPREEHVFFIAERPVGSSEDYHIAYSTQAAGTEGATPVTNMLAMVALNAVHRTAAIVSNEYEDGGAIGVITRDTPRRWVLTWRSVYVGC